MARSEEHREDLFAEATALVERIELSIASIPQPLVAGFRRDGCASFFFGSDPVYQFNRLGELRRAFAGELLYRAGQGRLAALRRDRSGTYVALVRHDLTAAESLEFLRTMRSRLIELRGEIDRKSAQLLRQLPAEANVLARVREWLERFADRAAIADSPRVG